MTKQRSNKTQTKRHPLQIVGLFLPGLLLAYLISLLIITKLPSNVSAALNVKTTTGGFGHSLVRFNEAETVQDVDLLFVGSSHTYRGFDPRVFAEYDLSSFNLGSSNQTPINSYYLLEKYLDSINPDTVVMEVYWGTLQNKDGAEATIDITSNAKVDNHLISMMLASGTIESINATMSNFVLQLVSSEQLDPSKQTDLKIDRYIDGGYVETDRTHNKFLDFPAKTIGVSDKQLDYLERIINLVQDRGKRIVLVRTPVSQQLVDSIRNFEGMTAPIKDLAEKYNVEFLDYNTQDQLDAFNFDFDIHFYDRHHLTKIGVPIFNNRLAQDLQQILD